MIINKKPLTISEVNLYAKDFELEKNLADYLKAYEKVPFEKAKKLAEELRALNNMKMKEETIVKLIDIFPQDTEDVNKVFNDVHLTEEESRTIFEIIKKY